MKGHIIMQWLSPSYPIGSFNFSQGLEYAVSQSLVTNEKDLICWIDENLDGGFLRNDAIFVKLAFYCDTKMRLYKLIELCNAFSCSKPKLEEQLLQGEAFSKVTPNADNAPFPIAIGLAAKKYELKIEEVLPLFLHANVTNLISSAQRLLPIGQSTSVKILSGLFKKIDKVSQSILVSQEEDILSSCYLTDSCSMFHETLDGKVFKS